MIWIVAIDRHVLAERVLFGPLEETSVLDAVLGQARRMSDGAQRETDLDAGTHNGPGRDDYPTGWNVTNVNSKLDRCSLARAVSPGVETDPECTRCKRSCRGLSRARCP